MRLLAVLAGAFTVLVLAVPARAGVFELGRGGTAAKAEAVESWASGTPADVTGSPHSSSAAYWVGEFRRRWQAERRTARARARTIRRLRAGLRARVTYPSGLERAFLCIHSFEGSWTDPGAPYWGGLQMDMQFQRAYGGTFLRAFGAADRWPVSVQLAVGMTAYLSGRGFGPWPATSRMCGLL